MNAYVDTSAILALEFGEPGALRARESIDRASKLISSNLMEAEVWAVMHRQGMQLDPKIISDVDWITPNRPLTDEFELVLSAGYLRGADLWHVAVALFASPDPSQISFITLDTRQREVARKIGFQT